MRPSVSMPFSMRPTATSRHQAIDDLKSGLDTLSNPSNTPRRPRTRSFSSLSFPGNTVTGRVHRQEQTHSLVAEDVQAGRSTDPATCTSINCTSFNSSIGMPEHSPSQSRLPISMKTTENRYTHQTGSKLYRRILRPRLRITNLSTLLTISKGVQQKEKEETERRRPHRRSAYDRFVQFAFFICLFIFLHALSGSNVPLSSSSNSHARRMPPIRQNVQKYRDKWKDAHKGFNHIVTDPEGHYSYSMDLPYHTYATGYSSHMDTRSSGEWGKQGNSSLEVVKDVENVSRTIGDLDSHINEEGPKASSGAPATSTNGRLPRDLSTSAASLLEDVSDIVQDPFDISFDEYDPYPYALRVHLPQESPLPKDSYRRKRQKAQERMYDYT